ncbi:MAG: hypothetical protein Q4B60_09765, partial [Erysipelotrichaceae bacterium]|nr:hypothetical protein [Erysipelotrichaceae bacterium]
MGEFLIKTFCKLFLIAVIVIPSVEYFNLRQKEKEKAQYEALHPSTISVSFYVDYLKDDEVLKTEILIKDFDKREKKLLLISNDEKYYGTDIEIAFKYLRDNPDPYKQYIIPKNTLGYKEDIYLRCESKTWFGTVIGKKRKLTLNQLLENVEFTDSKQNIPYAPADTSDNSCTLEEFLDLYEGDFDDTDEAIDWY